MIAMKLITMWGGLRRWGPRHASRRSLDLLDGASAIGVTGPGAVPDMQRVDEVTSSRRMFLPKGRSRAATVSQGGGLLAARV